MSRVAKFEEFDPEARDAVLSCLDKAIPGIIAADALELAKMVIGYLGPIIAFDFSNMIEPHAANRLHHVVITSKGVEQLFAQHLGGFLGGIDVGRSIVMRPSYRPDDNGDYPYEPDVNYGQIVALIRDIEERIRAK